MVPGPFGVYTASNFCRLAFLALLFLGKPAYAGDLKYRLGKVTIPACSEADVMEKFGQLRKDLNKILLRLGMPPTGERITVDGPESLFYLNNKMYLPVLKAIAEVREAVEGGLYCRHYKDQTTLNAVLHFASAAVATLVAGPDLAKELLDLHEAASSYNFNDETGEIAALSVMDIYNNYQGIEFARNFRGIPDGRSPRDFFIEEGLKKLEEGKLRTVSDRANGYCLIPKSPFGEPPSKKLLERPTDDPRTLEHYSFYQPQPKPLVKQDWDEVLDLGHPQEDPVAKKLATYLSQQACCREGDAFRAPAYPNVTGKGR